MRGQPLPSNERRTHGSLKMPADDRAILLAATTLGLYEMAAEFAVSTQTIKLHLRRLGLVRRPYETWGEFLDSPRSSEEALVLLKKLKRKR
jgi:hypothetical protein